MNDAELYDAIKAVGLHPVDLRTFARDDGRTSVAIEVKKLGIIHRQAAIAPTAEGTYPHLLDWAKAL